MDSHLKHLLDKYNLKLQYGPSHGKGCIVETPDGFPDLLVVKEGLSTEETEKVILHELGHHCCDDDTMSDYKRNPITRDRSEYSANKFLVDTYAKKYVEDVDKESANYLNLASFLNLKDVDMVKDILKTTYNVQN